MERAINRGKRMTKERRLAIQMWQEIVNKCKAGEDFNVAQFKDDFCKEHHLNWTSNCYFCQYCRSCSECPLDKNCFLYYEVRDKHDITSAELILNAIRGYTND